MLESCATLEPAPYSSRMCQNDLGQFRRSAPIRPLPPFPSRRRHRAGHGFSFHDFLSAMNPLQYLPVVGTIYRAVTGDVIPEALRQAGSMLVSGLLGGPIGLVINIATTIAEKVTGIDPEKIVAAQLNPPPVAVAPSAAPVAQPASLPMTAAQLAAYGVSTTETGTLKLGKIEGADVLNSIQLAGLGKTAAAAYAANQPPADRGPRRLTRDRLRCSPILQAVTMISTSTSGAAISACTQARAGAPSFGGQVSRSRSSGPGP